MDANTPENAGSSAGDVNQSAEKPKKKGTFQKGNPGYGFRRMKAKAEEAAPSGGENSPPASEGVPALLVAMRHVFTQPRAADTTPQQKECRKWLKNDLKGFMSKMAQLEKVYAQKSTKPIGGGGGKEHDGGTKPDGASTVAGATVEPVDEGTERCLAINRMILGEE